MLSLAMVIKNEANTLDQSIASVRDYVDEIVVGMDTLSSDGSAQIVERLADRIIPSYLSEELEKKGPKNNDGTDWGFSKARNDVFAACKPDNWRLVLDGHETVLQPGKLLNIIETAKSKKCDGVEVWILFEPEADGIYKTEFASTRLMAPGVYYNNPNHNVAVIKSLHVDHSLHIEHRKQAQAVEHRINRDKQRSDSNIEGLREKLRFESNSPRSWYYLAQTYKENARYREAIRAYQECLHFSVWNEERWHARYNMGICYVYIDEKEKAREQFILAIKEFPPMAEAYYQLGLLAYKQQNHHEAEVWFSKCVTMPMPKCRLFVNPRVYKQSRWDMLSMTYHNLGRYEDALQTGIVALNAAPNERIESNVKRWRSLINPIADNKKTIDLPQRRLVHYCDGMSFFGERLQRIHDFSKYNPQTDIHSSVMFLGLYFQEDYDLFKKHKGKISVFWNGSDVLRLLANQSWQQTLKSKPDVVHFCHNQQLQDELASIGIQASVHPIFFGDVANYEPSFKPTNNPQVYTVSHPGRNDEYGVPTVLKAAHDLPDFGFHIYGVDKEDDVESVPNVKFHGLVDEQIMDREIANFQGCIRLNKHDGFSQTVMKSILFAQYPICYADIPGTMKATTFEQLTECLHSLKEQKEPNVKLRNMYLEQFSKLPI